MNDAPTSGHLFLPLLVRAQLVACGMVLAVGLGIAGLGAADLSALRGLLGA